MQVLNDFLMFRDSSGSGKAEQRSRSFTLLFPYHILIRFFSAATAAAFSSFSHLFTLCYIFELDSSIFKWFF